MTLAEATQRLVELHDTTLRRLHDTIREHKYALRDLIEQAQEEVTALARPVAVVCEQVMLLLLTAYDAAAAFADV